MQTSRKLILFCFMWLIAYHHYVIFPFLPKKASTIKSTKNTNASPNNTNAVIKREWRYDRHVCSGLGDRLGLTFAMAGLGKLANAQIYVRWCDPTESRVYDLNVFATRFELPPSVILVSSSEFDNRTAGMLSISFENTEIPAAEAYDCVYTLAPKTFHVPWPVQQSEYTAAYKAAGLQFKPRSPASRAAFGRGHPTTNSTVVLHVRGGDKRTHDQQFCTLEAIKRIAAIGNLSLVVITDDKDLARSLVNGLMITDSSVYDDLATLHSALAIIQHSPDGWSAFSSVVAMFRGIPLLNTWKGNFNRIREFRRRGEAVRELHTCEDMPQFFKLF